MIVRHFFDKDTFTLTYVVYDESSKDGVIIDPVLNFDQASGKVSFTSFEELVNFIDTNKINVHMILETHAHADHISSSQYLKKRYPKATLAIGEHITKVQRVFKRFFNFKENFPVDGSQFDRLLKDRETLKAGTLIFQTIATAGHTPACVSYLFDQAVFTGDALFMPDFGTGRCDFPDASADDLYHSIHAKLYRLPEATRVYVGHDYQPGGRRLAFESTIKEQKERNIQLNQGTSKESFIAMRQSRDKTLPAPKLLLPSIQININAGKLPQVEDNDVAYLKIPLSFA